MDPRPRTKPAGIVGEETTELLQAIPEEYMAYLKLPRTVLLLACRPGVLGGLASKEKWDLITAPGAFFGICLAIFIAAISISIRLGGYGASNSSTGLYAFFLGSVAIPFITILHILCFVTTRGSKNVTIERSLTAARYLGGPIIVLFGTFLVLRMAANQLSIWHTVRHLPRVLTLISGLPGIMLLFSLFGMGHIIPKFLAGLYEIPASDSLTGAFIVATIAAGLVFAIAVTVFGLP
jgi:hypothetical protein